MGDAGLAGNGGPARGRAALHRPLEQSSALRATLRLTLGAGVTPAARRAGDYFLARLVGKSADEYATLRSDSHTFGRAAVIGVANRLVGDGTFVQSNLDQLALAEIEM